MDKTPPKPTGIDDKTNSSLLCHGRYGTDDMIEIWGAEKTFQYSLDAQAVSVKTLSDMHPDIIPPEHAKELFEKADLDYVKPQRIRELEAAGEHDIIAINKAWEEVVSPEAGAHINKARTSADTTETAKGLQIKKSLLVVVDSLENLRDITLENSLEWIDKFSVDQSHLYDALPTVAGRPFSFYGEMLQSDIDLLASLFKNSVFGKWGDATGNHHQATSLGVDGKELQKEYCERLELKHMDAAAQVPGREFLSDIIYGMARTAHTMCGLERYIRKGRGTDASIFKVPRGRKGSSAMPHKDMVGGNPTIEEQTGSYAHYMIGALTTSLVSSVFDYARDLEGSASDRIIFEDVFKWGDFVIRRLAKRMYELELIPERCRERLERTNGTINSQQLMTYLTDNRRTERPLTRDQAHELAAELATEAYENKSSFFDVVINSEEITSRFNVGTIRSITNPFEYIGQSKEIIQEVFNKYHGNKSLDGK
jgi:adenylosuccinate lyase